MKNLLLLLVFTLTTASIFGQTWQPLSSAELNNPVYTMAVDSAGHLYFGGSFTLAGSNSIEKIAKFDGTNWSAIGGGLPIPSSNVADIAVDLAGHVYVANGYFNSGCFCFESFIHRWNGTSWTLLGEVFDAAIFQIQVTAAGTVFAMGDFSSISGVSANKIAFFDGTNWQALGSGIGTNGRMKLFSNGDLFVANTGSAGGQNGSLAKWNGSTWTVLSTDAFNGTVWSLEEGATGDIYAAGSFTVVGALSTNRIAKWNGTAWSALGTGLNDIGEVVLFDNGDLYTGGFFTTAGGIPASAVAKWDGAVWSAMGDGLSGPAPLDVKDLVIGLTGNVVAGGSFSNSGGAPVQNTAKWVQATLPDCTTLSNPVNGAVNVPSFTDIAWVSAGASGATGYRLSIGTTSGGTDILNNLDVGNVLSYDLTANLPYLTTIYVTVTPYSSLGDAVACIEESFTTISGSSCIPGGVIFTTQAQIDAFPTNFPGCTEILGHVTIEECCAGNITNLNGLSQLTGIDGGLFFHFNPMLVNLNGLENLLNLNGPVEILSNDMSSLAGIQNINPAGITNLFISNNPNLGMCDVQSICDYLAIPSNPANISGNATGCANRIEVETACTTPPSCTNLTNPANGATNVPVTTSLTWATASGAAGYRLTVGTTSGGTDIMNNVDVGNVTTYDLPGNFPFNTTIYVKITPYNTYGDAVGCMEESFMTGDYTCLSGGITFTNQAQIDAFPTNYPNCTEILGDVLVKSNPINAITNLNGLSQIISIGGELTIRDNLSLTSLSGLDNLIIIGEELVLFSNNYLANLSGLNNLTSIGGRLDISYNNTITSLSGLDSMTSIGGVVNIYGNASLTSLSGLENLNSIGGYIEIGNNSSLNSIQGIMNINPASINSPFSFSDDIQIYNNSLLSTCEISSICDAIIVHGATTDIYSNAAGCNSQTEVEAACGATLPPCTNLTIPINGATNVPITTSLTWSAASNATGYRLNVGSTPGGTDILNNFDAGNVTTYNPPGNFPYNTTIYVSITPYNASGDAVGCTEESFTTVASISNDDCANAINIPVNISSCVPGGSYSTVGATNSLANACMASIYEDTWYKFTPTTTGVTLEGNAFASVKIELFDACGGVSLACSPAAATFNTTWSALTAGQEYFFRIGVISGEGILNLCLWEHIPPSLSVTTTPACSGNDGTVTGTVTGGLSPFDFFLSNGDIILGDVDGNVTFTGLSPGTYEMVVADWFGQADNDTFDIQGSPPINDECSNAITLSMGIGACSSVGYSIECATVSPQPQPCLGGLKDIWFTTTASQTGFNFTTGDLPIGAFFWLEVYDGNCLTLNYVECIEEVQPDSNYFINSGPGTFYLRLAYFGNEGIVNLCVWESTTLLNNDCANAINIPVNIGSCTPGGNFSTIGATNSLSNPCMGSLYKDTWYQFTPTASEVTLEGSGFWSSAKVELFDGCGGNSIDCQGGGSTFSVVWNSLIAGNTYWFRIGVLPSQGEGEIDLCIWESSPLSPTLLSLTPTTVKIKYHAPIDPATANATNLKIWGDETGLRSGTYTVASDTVTFVADDPFRAGELVHITSKSGLLFTGGGATMPFAWQRPSIVTNPTAATFDTIGTDIILPAVAYAYGYSASMADLDLDGLQDLVYLYFASAGAATNLRIYLRNSNGTFAAPLTYSNTESYPNLVGTPDLNNDGYPDLVISHNVPSRVQVRLNNGSGGFGAASLYTVSNYCNGARVADMDNDGDLDIIAYAGNASLSLNTISVLKNNGNGTFATQVTTNTSVFGTSCQPADLDNDGDMDLAYTSNSAFGSSKVFRVYQNDGTGALTLNNSEANNQEKTLMPAFDYNGDGNVDLITRNPSTEVYLNNSGISYSLASPALLSAEEGWPLSGDLDGDGDLDVLIPNSYNGTNWNTLPVKILLNNGTGTFATNTTSLVLPTFFGASNLTDYDEDGDLDHIYLDPATGEIKVLRNGSTASPICTNLTEPLNGATNVPISTTLTWATSPTATGYKLSAGTSPGGTDILNNVDVGNVTTYDPPGNFPYSTTIYVTITPYNAGGDATGCVEESFITADQCPPSDVLLLTQAEVDAFALIYPACTQINGSLTIGNFGYDSDIGDLSGLSSLTAANSVYVYSNPLLTNLIGLDNFTTISSEFYIYGNNGLTDLTGLGALITVGGIKIAFNNNLVNLVGIGNITGLTLDLQINFNPALTSLAGLSNLAFTGLDLGITYNNVLSDLTALSNLDSVGGHLTIGYCPALSSLAGLQNLTYIINELTIINNTGLVSLLDLSNLDTIGGNLEINGNPLLSNCEAQAICDYLAAPPGTVTIQNNALGCNTQAEVQLACAPSCTNLADPSNGATNVPITATLTWAASSAAIGYRLSIGTSPGGTDILNNFDVGNVSTYDPPGDFPYGTTIYVKITPYNANGDAPGCLEESFITEGCLPNLVIAADPVPAGTYMSLGDLTAHDATVASMTTVVFTSDTGILLEHDFEVESGAVFEAFIQGCPTNLVPPIEEK